MARSTEPTFVTIEIEVPAGTSWLGVNDALALVMEENRRRASRKLAPFVGDWFNANPTTRLAVTAVSTPTPKED